MSGVIQTNEYVCAQAVDEFGTSPDSTLPHFLSCRSLADFRPYLPITQEVGLDTYQTQYHRTSLVAPREERQVCLEPGSAMRASLHGGLSIPNNCSTDSSLQEVDTSSSSGSVDSNAVFDLFCRSQSYCTDSAATVRHQYPRSTVYQTVSFTRAYIPESLSS